jgi:hypothetical protein
MSPDCKKELVQMSPTAVRMSPENCGMKGKKPDERSYAI